MRVARILARAGRCSRREADVAIAEGRVVVNGVKAHVGQVVDAATKPAIDMDGRRVPSIEEKPRVFLAYKRRGELVTREGTDDRPSIFARLQIGRHVASVGRLDYETEGLLVLTTCGMLARGLEHPRLGGVKRVYQVEAKGAITPEKLVAMRRGLTIDKVRYRPLDVKVGRIHDGVTALEVSCSEGKKRMIRNIFQHLRLLVVKLKRTHFGPFSISQLRKGKQVTEVPLPRDIAHLAHSK